MRTVVFFCFLLCFVNVLSAGAQDAEQAFSVQVRQVDRAEFPGVVLDKDADPLGRGTVDCNSPAHWDGETMYLFNSAGYPCRCSGPDVFHLSRPVTRVSIDNEEGWTMGGRWIEATYLAKDGQLYMWYHNEPPVIPGKTAPRIGSMVSTDNGLSWRDLGIVLEAPADSNNPETANFYFCGGNGDFCVNADAQGEYLYFFISTYNKDTAEQGVSVARMSCADLEKPVGKVWKWRDGWNEPGLGGHVTPIFPSMIDWHRPDANAFWGSSVHFNTHLNAWVMFLNRAKDKDWIQEGVYVSFNTDISDPKGWTKPEKVIDAAELRQSKWYPQVIGIDTTKRETDKIAGKTARLFVAGVSLWEVDFLKAEETKALK